MNLKDQFRQTGRTTNALKQAFFEQIKNSRDKITIVYVCPGRADYYLHLFKKILNDERINVNCYVVYKNKFEIRFINHSRIIFTNVTEFENTADYKFRGIKNLVLVLDHAVEITKETYDIISPCLMT